jgi:hypothetical protein
MVMNGDGEDLLRPILSDDILVENFFDFGRFWEFGRNGLFSFLPFLGDNVIAEVDTFIADVDRRAGDQLSHLFAAFTAKRTFQPVVYFFLFCHYIPSSDLAFLS